MSRLKVVQLASFRGNIGDQANVIGTRHMLTRALGRDTKYTDLEYLEYEPDPAWGGRKFDSEFIRQINDHDLFILGGGGFFELAVDKSATGTPIDITLENLARIKTPIVVHGMGFDTSAGVTAERISRFGEFIECLLQRPKSMVSFRNDGSLSNLRSIYGNRFADFVHVIPDGGFFIPQGSHSKPDWLQDYRCIGINIAGDSLGFRFNDIRGSDGNLIRFLTQLAGVLNRTLNEDQTLHVIFFPHIPEDLHLIFRLLQSIGPPNMRKRVSVAPYCPGISGARDIFNLYSHCELVIGMRFHANVCPIGLGVPTIGLVTHPQIAALYGELGVSERAIDARSANFAEQLEGLVHDSMRKPRPIRSCYQALRIRLQNQIQSFHIKIAHLTGIESLCGCA